MRRRFHREVIPVLKWEAPGPYPTTEPPDVWNLLHEWSQDLVYSSNNGYGSDQPYRSSTGDTGSDFLCYRRFYEEGSSLGSGVHGFANSQELPPAPVGRPFYMAPQFAYADQIRNTTFPLPLPTDRSEMNALASEAISKVAPNKPEADLATFLGELREGLPRGILLHQNGKERARACYNAGDEYLNVEFGWKPLLRDVRSFASAVSDSERILSQYEAGAGKLIRRRYSFPTKLDISEQELVNPYAVPVPTVEPRHYEDGALGELTKITSTKVERWFSAAFLYSVPPRGTPQGYAARANKLLGTNLDPAMLWNLAPWSWALDWVGNLGTIAENLSLFSSDSLVMPWCYMMERKTVSVEYFFRSYSSKPYKSYSGQLHLRQKFTTVMKSRIKGTPYGFDVDWPDLSGRQLAILAALGISRSA